MEHLQVRFHPLRSEILASGSLDHEVRLWDANTSECIGSCDFCMFYDFCFSSICKNVLQFMYKAYTIAIMHWLWLWKSPPPPPPKQIVPLLPLLSMLKENSLLLHRVTRWCFLSLNFSNSFILLEWAVVPSDLIVLTLEIVFQLYIWPYNNKEEASSPIIVLKTRRSLRAVHFHPHAAPFVLTAEVNYPMGV